jgi:hypothetical protein
VTIRYVIEIYAFSDSLGAETCITVRSPVPLPAVKNDMSLPELLILFGSDAYDVLATEAQDWRLMTPTEAREYRDNI